MSLWEGLIIFMWLVEGNLFDCYFGVGSFKNFYWDHLGYLGGRLFVVYFMRVGYWDWYFIFRGLRVFLCAVIGRFFFIGVIFQWFLWD
jgi:hypothetical protein